MISSSNKFIVSVFVIAFCIVFYGAIALIWSMNAIVGLSVLALSFMLSAGVITIVVRDVLKEPSFDWRNHDSIFDDCFTDVRALAARVHAELK